MNKHKFISLFSLYEGGFRGRVILRIYRNGTINERGGLKVDNHRLVEAKRTAKKRELGFHLISLVHEGCGYHHVNFNDVVAIPLDIHAAISHTLLDGSAFNLEGVLG